MTKHQERVAKDKLAAIVIADTINGMQIEYNPDKDAINRQKHGFSLAQAQYFDWNNAYIEEDTRYAYGEQRMVGLGFIEVTLFYIAFVEREEVTRVFSLRPATKQEFRKYVHYLTGR